jgi:TatD DNase family protein
MSTELLPSLIDIGANLGHQSFDLDLSHVIARAKAVGIHCLLVTGTDLESTQKALRLAQRYPSFLYATAGIHPHEAQSCTDEDFAVISALSQEELIKAIGETGLDFNRDYSPRPVQETVFEKHLQLACTVGKTVFLHQRDAHQRFLPILKTYRDDLHAGGVVHCFTGEKRELYDYLDMDMHIGITGWICDERRGQHLLEFLHDIPADRLLLETDAPYLLPRTLRPKPKSRRNEPCNIREVLKMAALATGRSETLIAHQTSENARRLFKLP